MKVARCAGANAWKKRDKVYIALRSSREQGLRASRGGHPMKYMAMLDTEPLSQNQDVGGPQQTLAGKVGHPVPSVVGLQR